MEKLSYNEPNEELIAKLKKEYGVETESSFLSSIKQWFQGDFGSSIDARFLLTIAIVFFIVLLLITYLKYKRK